MQEGIGDRLRRRQREARAQPEHVHLLGLEPGRGLERDDLHDPGLGKLGLLLLGQAEVGDGGDRAGELARGGLGLAPDVGRGELGEPGERAQALDDVGLGGEQLLAAQAEAIDQAVDVEVGAGRVDRRHARAVELEEHADPLARLGRDLRGLGRGGERADHVEFAAPRDLRAAGDVDRAQVDRRPGERAHDGGGVGGVGEQPQPGEHVADLRALEERGLADQLVRDGALLERDGHRLPLL